MTDSLDVSCQDSLENADWDDFLKSTRLGHFQQSALWARYKRYEGWQCSRVTVRCSEGIVAGFQILWKPTRLGNIGYISKGPVVENVMESARRAVLDALPRQAAKLGLRALILQAPDHSAGYNDALRKYDFLPNKLKNIIRANLEVNLQCEPDGIDTRLRADVRQRVRQAQRRGVIIREGDEKDLAMFFDLMIRTCERQGVAPSPACKKALEALWSAFRPGGHVRLTFAEVDGEIVSSQMTIAFGDKCTIWKKGWNSQKSKASPNHLITHETLVWGQKHGYQSCDFVALDRGIAASILAGKPLNEEQKKSRDCFNLGFGGQPILLPEPMLYIARPVLRSVYRVLLEMRWLHPLLRHV